MTLQVLLLRTRRTCTSPRWEVWYRSWRFPSDSLRSIHNSPYWTNAPSFHSPRPCTRKTCRRPRQEAVGSPWRSPSARSPVSSCPPAPAGPPGTTWGRRWWCAASGAPWCPWPPLPWAGAPHTGQWTVWCTCTPGPDIGRNYIVFYIIKSSYPFSQSIYLDLYYYTWNINNKSQY